MNSIRKFLGFVVTALALAAVSLPSSAAQPSKIFGLDITPANVTTSPVTLTAKFSNLTPNGNSVINTVILTPLANPTLTVTGVGFPQGGNQVQCPATTVNSSGQTVPVPLNSICVANIPSVMKAACTPTACNWSMTVTVSLPSNCAAYKWAGQAFAGNSFNGDVFAYQSGNLTTTIGTQCPHNITATYSGPANSGSIAPAGVTSVAWDGSQTYTITANTGFYIVDVKVDGSSVGAVASYPFTMVEADHTIAATVAANTLSIVSKPTSAVVGTTFQVGVGITPAGGSVSADTSACGAATATLDASSTSSLAVFNITIPSTYTGNTCTIVFNATNYTSIPLSGLPVYKGTIFCGDYDSSKGNTDFTFDPNLDKTYVGDPGWGLRRGPNKDGSACAKVNYTCNLDATANIASCSFDKASGQLATFKYVFLWNAVGPDSSGFTLFQPRVSWNIPNPNPDPTSADWVPALACVSDLFPTLVPGNPSTYPTTILPPIPNVAPFVGNPYPQYLYTTSPTNYAEVCIGQQGWTSVGSPSGAVQVQYWDKVIDESDMLVKGP